MRVPQRLLQRVLVADRPEGRAVICLRAFLRGVAHAELDRIDAELDRHLVEDALHPEDRNRRARRPVRRDLGPVHGDVVAGDLDVLQVVAGEGAHRRHRHRRARERSGLEVELRLGGGDASVLAAADLDPRMRARGRAGRAEHVLPAHGHLDRPVGLPGKNDGERLEIDIVLAAESAAELGRDHADLRNVHLEKLRALRADDEMALGGGVDLDLAVLGVARERGLGLDIALVHGLGVEFALDDEVRLREALLHVALGEIEHLGEVGRLLRRRVDALGDLFLVQQRRVFGHRLHGVDHMRQHLVIDLDQSGRAPRDGVRGSGHGGDRVAVIEHLLARHHVPGHVAEIDDQLAGGGEFDRHLGKVVAGDHGLDALERLGLVGADGEHPRMGVGAPDHAAVELSRQVDVGAVARAAGDLVDSVGADRPRADDLEILVLVFEHRRHGQTSLISRAASATASTIL